MWVLLSILSAFLLGIYDIFKKWSLNGNAVIPVLFFSTLTGGLLFVPLACYSHFHPEFSGNILYIRPQPAEAHFYFLLKSVIVSSSWLLAYSAMKNLPVTIASPIRSSGPLWTLTGAIIFFGESMNLWQWIGILFTILCYYFFSKAGKKEGISFRSNKWVLFMTLATLIGSFSGLFDKYLIRHFDRLAMQCWYSVYMVLIIGLIFLFAWLSGKLKNTPFKWRYSIILIGLTLIVSDLLYFIALSKPGALISVISTVRRSGVIVSFSLGALIFHEHNIKEKALILLGIVAGIVIIAFASN